MSDGLYIYGIARKAEAPIVTAPAVHDSDNPILHVDCGLYTVLASRISIREVDATRRYMMAHTRVLERAMEQATLLPMRFGMVVPDEEALRARITRHAEKIGLTIPDLDGRIEVGLRVAFSEGVASKEIGKDRPDLARKSEGLAKRNPNETYYERIDLGRAVEAALIEKKRREGQRIAALLKPLAVRMIELGISDEDGILNAAMLVARKDEPALARTVEALDAEQPGRFAMRYVAPVPPFNFVRMTLDDAPLKAA
jgi:hypothetical protein